MKAKRIKRLRKEIKHFRMWESLELFGIGLHRVKCEELAIHIYGLTLLDAVKRYYSKRPFECPQRSWCPTTNQWAKIAVLPDGEPLRHIKFFR